MENMTRRKKKFQELTILDDFMFGVVMEDPDNCKGLLECLLNISIGRVEVNREKSFQYHPEYRGIRLDVYAGDEAGTRYDVEMQVKKTAVLKRSRYYHTQMDIDQLLTGKDYEELTDSYVIFICNYDPFGGKKYKYTIDKHCIEMPEIDVRDGIHTVILSNRGENPDEVPEELVEFLEYTKRGANYNIKNKENEFIRQIHDTIQKIKKDRSVEERYMKLQLVLSEERREGRAAEIFDLVQQGDISPERGAERLSLSLEEFQKEMDEYILNAIEDQE